MVIIAKTVAVLFWLVHDWWCVYWAKRHLWLSKRRVLKQFLAWLIVSCKYTTEWKKKKEWWRETEMSSDYLLHITGSKGWNEECEMKRKRRVLSDPWSQSRLSKILFFTASLLNMMTSGCAQPPLKPIVFYLCCTQTILTAHTACCVNPQTVSYN